MTDEQREALAHMESMLKVRLVEKPLRFTHSQAVAACAVSLAEVYGVDSFQAAAAGILHDWDKALSDSELLARAAQYGVEVVGSPAAAVGLLHGPVAARELPQIFPALDAAILQAIARHTVGACDMTPLDMVVFVADAIEPGRHGAYADELRAQVGVLSLEELFFRCFAGGLAYVISGGRYLYPTAVTIYNTYAARCGRD